MSDENKDENKDEKIRNDVPASDALAENAAPEATLAP